MAKVYIKIDNNSIISEINSDIFLDSITGYKLIDEGAGDKYVHAQTAYLSNGLVDEQGRYNYKYDKKVTELSEVEKQKLFPAVEVVNEFELLKESQERTEQAVQDLILMMLGGA